MEARAGDGVELWWSSTGDGTPVLLIPGRGDSSDVYPRSFRRALVEHGFQVIVFDPRDAGLSDDGGDTSTMTDMADDAIAVLDAAEVERAHVAGFSMGGLLLVDLATRCADQVRSATFLSAMSPDPAAGMGADFFAEPTPDPIDAWLRVMGETTEDDRAWLASELEASTQRAAARPEAGLRHQEAAFRSEWPTLESLGTIEVRALIIHGDADTVLPVAHAEALAGGIPQSELVVRAGMGHIPRPADWDVITPLIVQHLTAPR